MYLPSHATITLFFSLCVCFPSFCSQAEEGIRDVAVTGVQTRIIPISDFFFFFQAEDGIRDLIVTGVQTCALPILAPTGTITFTAYAPTANGSADVSCGSAVFTDIEAVDSTGKATSGSFTPSGDRKSVV